MSAMTLIETALIDGVMLSLTDAGTVKVVGQDEMVAQWLPRIREHKQAIIEALKGSSDSDERRHCHQCRNLSLKGVCRAPERGELRTAKNYKPIDSLPRRCEAYLPGDDDPDRRAGAERWPWLLNPPETVH